jgi:hypothetical protein
MFGELNIQIININIFYFCFEPKLGTILDWFHLDISKIHILYPNLEIVDILHDNLLQFKEWPTFLVILEYDEIHSFMSDIQVNAKLKFFTLQTYILSSLLQKHIQVFADLIYVRYC